jgi:hypothetical protein
MLSYVFWISLALELFEAFCTGVPSDEEPSIRQMAVENASRLFEYTSPLLQRYPMLTPF